MAQTSLQPQVIPAPLNANAMTAHTKAQEPNSQGAGSGEGHTERCPIGVKDGTCPQTPLSCAFYLELSLDDQTQRVWAPGGASEMPIIRIQKSKDFTVDKI